VERITTRIKFTYDGPFEDVVQQITVEGSEFVYHAEGRPGEVRVDAEEYLDTLERLWPRRRVGYMGDDD
jgi:hypothetical protein